MHLTHEVFYYQVIMLPLLVNFLPPSIHSSLTYDIPKLLLPWVPFVVTYFLVPAQKRKKCQKNQKYIRKKNEKIIAVKRECQSA